MKVSSTTSEDTLATPVTTAAAALAAVETRRKGEDEEEKRTLPPFTRHQTQTLDKNDEKSDLLEEKSEERKKCKESCDCDNCYDYEIITTTKRNLFSDELPSFVFFLVFFFFLDLFWQLLSSTSNTLCSKYLCALLLFFSCVSPGSESATCL